jgi:hypothetical protein
MDENRTMDTQRSSSCLGLLVVVFIVGLAACSSTGDGDGVGGAGATSQGGAGTGGAGATSGVVCDGATHEFPTFDKSCADVADCVRKDHQVDCCGTLAAIGINVAEETAFDAAEAECLAQYPGCGCAPDETIAEDGNRSDFSIELECSGGTCSTYVP